VRGPLLQRAALAGKVPVDVLLFGGRCLHDQDHGKVRTRRDRHEGELDRVGRSGIDQKWQGMKAEVRVRKCYPLFPLRYLGARASEQVRREMPAPVAAGILRGLRDRLSRLGLFRTHPSSLSSQPGVTKMGRG